MKNAHIPSQKPATAAGERLLSRRMLRQLVPVSDMTIWRWERDGRFPRHLSVNGRNYWLQSEVSLWLAEQERGQVPALSARRR